MSPTGGSVHSTPVSSQQRTYGYAEIAERIAAALGERPSLSTLRAASAQTRRTSTPKARPRLTLGMPQPLPHARTAPAQFDAAEVDRWLANHPLRGWLAAVEQLRQDLQTTGETEGTIARALQAGLSWRQITRILVEVDHKSRTTGGVHKKYRHLTDPAPPGEDVRG